MAEDDVISISSDEDGEAYVDRRAVLEPAILNVVAALGGYEGTTYKLGDEAHGCLKDLKKFWRKDDTDDERTVARIFWKARVLPNDLAPMLLETAGKGNVEDKRAIACADLMTAMTWPIDLSEELKELDDELDKETDYTQLLLSHLHYKAALLQPGVIQALFGILLPPLAKDKKERKERDVQIITVILYLIRNLAFIKDLPPNMHLSADQAEFSTLQSKLITTLSDTNVLDLLLTISSNSADDALFNGWNTLVLEIVYLLFRGVKPSMLTANQAQQPQKNLVRLLAMENSLRKEHARQASSRHSRFGTTITVQLNPKKKGETSVSEKTNEDGLTRRPTSVAPAPLVFHRQQAISGESGSILDLAKRRSSKKEKKLDELGREDNLSMEARVVLQSLARSFVESCFNPFLSSLLKDIKSERPKITEKDNLRLLFVTKWFLEYFLSMRAMDKDNGVSTEWNFEFVAEVVERGWIMWVLKRMREAVEDKPKLWTELQAGVECLTQLLLLIDNMSASSSADPMLNDAAELLQQQLVYNGEVLDIAFESLRVYKEGTQSLAYLNSSVHLAYVLLRMLEKWSKARGGEVYVRKRMRRKARKSGKGLQPEEEGIPDVEDVEDMGGEEDHMIQETTFTFETFEARFAHAEVTHTLLTYLARYQEFDSPESMKRVVSLMHRQAVRAKAEGLFFKVSTLNLFKTILAEEKSLPKAQPYKDLVSLINFILRKFFQSLAEDSFLMIEAFFPKNRGQWKAYSSWEPEEKGRKERGLVEDTRFLPDVQVKKGHSWSEQMGIAVAALIEDGKIELIDWTKEILSTVIGQRERLIEETDGPGLSPSQPVNNIEGDPEDDDVREAVPKSGPSNDAIAKFTDYLIPYLSDEHADAATKNPKLKLVFRLVKFYILDENAEELEWYVPAAIVPSDLQRSYNIICQFVETPLGLKGKKASQLLSKKTRRRVRRALSPDSGDDDVDFDNGDGEPRKQRKEKKKKEKEQYKSAQFIEDSDAEYGDSDAFFEKEKQLRERLALAAAEGKLASMKSTGTKKRRKKAKEGAERGKKKRKHTDDGAGVADGVDQRDSQRESDESSADEDGNSGKDSGDPSPVLELPKARPKPRPRYSSGRASSSAGLSPRGSPPSDTLAEQGEENITGLRHASELQGGRGKSADGIEPTSALGSRRKGRMVISDDED